MKEIQAVVSGKVQMVMYREFAKKKARSHGVVGMVQNRGDRTVHVIAQGSEWSLKKFINDLEVGPHKAEVENVDVTWRSNPTEEFEEFKVIY